MKIHHLGAKNCVTGSCHLLQTSPGFAGTGVNILVDCGKAYGHDPELPFDQFPVQPDRINYLFLTHAHIDHIGRVPDPPDTCDLLVLESTYGDRNHTSRKDRVNTLEKLLHKALADKALADKALADKGIVYIPAFSLGRTQELIYELDRIGDMTRFSPTKSGSCPHTNRVCGFSPWP